MGSPLSPVIANFYMEEYENAALDLAPPKTLLLVALHSDTFVIWPHGPDKLKDFLHYLTASINPFTEGHLLLDLDIYTKPDGQRTQSVPKAHTHQSLPQHQVPSSHIH
jgi:hypothetical protein